MIIVLDLEYIMNMSSSKEYGWNEIETAPVIIINTIIIIIT